MKYILSALGLLTLITVVVTANVGWAFYQKKMATPIVFKERNMTKLIDACHDNFKYSYHCDK